MTIIIDAANKKLCRKNNHRISQPVWDWPDTISLSILRASLVQIQRSSFLRDASVEPTLFPGMEDPKNRNSRHLVFFPFLSESARAQLSRAESSAKLHRSTVAETKKQKGFIYKLHQPIRPQLASAEKRFRLIGIKNTSFGQQLLKHW